MNGALRERFDAVDGWLRRIAERVDDALSRIPRRWWETGAMVSFAVLLAFLASKSFIYAFAALVVLGAAVLVISRPDLMTYMLVVMIPVVWINLLGKRLRVMTFLTAVSLAFIGTQAILRRTKPRFEPIYGAVFVYLAFCFLSLFNSVDLSFSVAGMKYYIFALLFGLVLIMSVKDVQQVRVIVTILLAWGVINSVLSVAQSVISPVFYPAYQLDVFGMDIVSSYSVGQVRRASGTFESGPRLAMFLLLTFAFAMTYYFRGVDRRTPVWAALIAVIALGLFVSFTRIAVVLGAAYFFVYQLFEGDRRRMIRAAGATLLVGGIVMTLLQLVVPNEVTGAMEARFTQEGDQVYLDRFYFLYNAIMAFFEHPFLGWGVKTYTLHSWDFMQRFPVPWRSLAWNTASLAMPENVPVHNDYGRMLAETGIFSLAAFIAMLTIAYRNLTYALRKLTDPYLSATASAFRLFLLAMMAYWFFHEYVMEEPFVSVLPFAFSIILKRMADRQDESDAAEAPA